MKIWFAADIDLKIPGGVAHSMLELADGLRNRGHIITFITKNNLPNHNYLVFSFKLSILLITAMYNRPDWIIARSTDSLFCLLVIKLLNIKTQVLLHNHGWEERVYSIEKKMSKLIISHNTTWKARFIRFPLLRLTLRLCTYCLNVNKHEKRFLKRKYPFAAHKLLSIPNGVHCKQSAYWQNLSLPPPNFLCVGNMSWKKNITHTLCLFSCLKREVTDSHLYSVGTGIEDTSFFHSNNVNENGITNIPQASFKKMNTWYTTCPYMIVSSRFEGCSLTILEALSYGIVVFATGIESNREIIQHGYNGFLITGSNIHDDAKIIVNELKKNDTILTIRERAAETAGHFSWSRQVLRLEEILCRE